MSSHKMRDSSIQGSPLPPSIEKAYRDKCIHLKRRIQEVEEENGKAQLRKIRLERAVTKQRLLRALLLEQLAKTQKSRTTGADDDSESQPPTPIDRSMRMKRPYHRRSSPQTGANQPNASSPPAHGRSRSRPGTGTNEISLPIPDYPRTPSPSADLPTFTELHRSIRLRDGRDKVPPYTIRDLHHRHLIRSDFEKLPAEVQRALVDDFRYVPFDERGRRVLLWWDAREGKFSQIFPEDEMFYNELLQNEQDGEKAEKEGRSVDKETGDWRAGDSGRYSPREKDGYRSSTGGGFTAANA